MVSPPLGRRDHGRSILIAIFPADQV